MGDATIKCMPLEKPEDCMQAAWTTLTSLQSLITCPMEMLLGVGAPAYLSVPNWKECAESYQPEGSSHKEVCLPSRKPAACSQSSWTAFKEVWTGIGCPRSVYTHN